MSRLYILHHDRYFGQGLPTFKSMSIESMAKGFRNCQFDVELLSFEELSKHKVVDDATYICGSHQNKQVKEYLDDILDIKFHNRDNLFPSKTLIKAHDNKGYQGVLAEELSLSYVSQAYYVERKEIDKKSVIKAIGGAGSGGVGLVSSTRELSRFIRKITIFDIGLKRLAYLFRSRIYKLLAKGEYSNEQWDYYRNRERYVIQDFIEGLDFDYKVLVFFDKVFVLKRSTRKNDFRASGSGIFDFIEVEDSLLDFAISFRKTLSTPYVSLDLIEINGTYSCIEFQAVHFGPYTQMESPWYYEHNGSDWVKVSNETVLEELVVESIVKKIENDKEYT